MKTRTKAIIGAFTFVILALAFDVHLYLFDRQEYLLRKEAEQCANAEMAARDYQECLTIGWQDKRCNVQKAEHTELAGKCDAAQARSIAYRQRSLAD